MMVRNEAAIIADSVGHLLGTIGVDRLYVADNGSTDRTYAILRAIAATDARLMVRIVPGPYDQPRIMRWMIEKAVEDGADWLLPNDADEFFWPDGATLRRLCADARAGAGYLLQVHNFVQLDWVARDRPGSIETMLFRAVPDGASYEGPERVQGGLPFVRARFVPKLLVRATPDLHLGRGSHTATGLAGPIRNAPMGALLHAPIRARNDLLTRVEHGRRLIELVDDPASGWHLRRLVGMDADTLDAEWLANSTQLRWPPREGFRLDLRLRALAKKVRGYRALAMGATGPPAVTKS